MTMHTNIPKVMVNDVEVPGIELDFGGAAPKFDSNLDGSMSFSGVSISKNVYGHEHTMYLSKEEITALYEYAKTLN